MIKLSIRHPHNRGGNIHSFPDFSGSDDRAVRCSGLYPYTGGCVAAPEDTIKHIMRNVREGCIVVIDTQEDPVGRF